MTARRELILCLRQHCPSTKSRLPFSREGMAWSPAETHDYINRFIRYCERPGPSSWTPAWRKGEGDTGKPRVGLRLVVPRYFFLAAVIPSHNMCPTLFG